MEKEDNISKIFSQKYLAFVGAIASCIAIILELIKLDGNYDYSKIFVGIIGALVGFLICYVGLRFLLRFLKTPTSKVFIAHSSFDKNSAELISSTLAKHRIKVIDEDDIIVLGQDITANFKGILDKFDYVIVLISKDSKNDKYLNRIVELSKFKKIVPFIIDEESSIPKSLSNLPAYHFKSNGINSLTKQLLQEA